MPNTTLTIQVVGLDELRRKFQAAPLKVSAELHRALLQAGIMFQRFGREEAPVDQGIMRNKIGFRMRGGGVEIGPFGSKYAAAVHEGTRPHFPPIKALTGKEESLDLWARRHGMDPFLLARSIARKGTKANPFMSRAADRGRNDVRRLFQRAVARIVEDV